MIMSRLPDTALRKRKLRQVSANFPALIFRDAQLRSGEDKSGHSWKQITPVSRLRGLK